MGPQCIVTKWKFRDRTHPGNNLYPMLTVTWSEIVLCEQNTRFFARIQFYSHLKKGSNRTFRSIGQELDRVKNRASLYLSRRGKLGRWNNKTDDVHKKRSQRRLLSLFESLTIELYGEMSITNGVRTIVMANRRRKCIRRNGCNIKFLSYPLFFFCEKIFSVDRCSFIY